MNIVQMLRDRQERKQKEQEARRCKYVTIIGQSCSDEHITTCINPDCRIQICKAHSHVDHDAPAAKRAVERYCPDCYWDCCWSD